VRMGGLLITKDHLEPHQKPAVLFAANSRYGIIVMRPGRGKTAVAMAAIHLARKKGLVGTALVWTHKRGLEAYRKLSFGNPLVIVDTTDDLRSLSGELDRDPDRVFVVSTGLINRWQEEWKEQKQAASRKKKRKPTGDEAIDPVTGETLDDPSDDEFNASSTPIAKAMDTSPSDIEPTLSVLYRLSTLSGFTVIDEIHNYRVPTNSTSQGLKYFMKACRGRKLGMTATPFYNTLENAFEEYSLLSPAILGTYDNFKLHYLVTEERETQAYRWINTPLGKRKVLVPTTFTEVKGYKNIDAFMEVLKPYLYLDQGTEFAVSSMLARYEVESPSAYAEVIQGLDLSSCIALTIAGEGTTSRRIFKTGETLQVTVPGMDLGWSLREVSDITAGLDVLLETREGPRSYRVMGVSRQSTEADLLARLIPLVQYLSVLPEKVKALMDILDKVKHGHGALVFCVYHDTIDYLKEVLEAKYHRTIEVIRGGESDMTDKLAGLPPDAFVLISRVALQSLDFYYDTLIVYEPVTNPGSFEQLQGRITRMNSRFRGVDLWFVIGEKTIDHYYYERLRFLMRNNPFSHDIPLPETTLGPRLKGSKASLQVLRDLLLWRKK
jgi:hypothetical protein